MTIWQSDTESVTLNGGFPRNRLFSLRWTSCLTWDLAPNWWMPEVCCTAAQPILKSLEAPIWAQQAPPNSENRVLRRMHRVNMAVQSHEKVYAWSITALSLGKSSRISRKKGAICPTFPTLPPFSSSMPMMNWHCFFLPFLRHELCTSPSVSQCHAVALKGPWGPHLASTEPSSHAWLQMTMPSPLGVQQHWYGSKAFGF